MKRALNAEFLKDYNIPDGYRCEPKTKFIKTWLMKNTGKVEWNSEQYPVKLVCIGGNINTANQIDQILVPHTKVNETASISVDLVAPQEPGTYFSEWVLSCYGFHFGPRIWCTIQVYGANTNLDSNNNRENLDNTNLSDYSNMLQKDLIQSASENQTFFLNFCDMKSKDRSVGVSPIEIVNDDFDNEFVLIPDCFDLSKKWKPSNDSEKENDMTIVNYPTANDDSKELNINNAENQEEESKLNDNKQQTVKDKPMCSSIRLDENVTLSEFEKQREEEQNYRKYQNSSISTFNMMKDAFLNLRGPSYVSEYLTGF